jgi:hypothetical protein
MFSSPSKDIISTIIKHDRKVTSYKIALLRSINDVVLNYPDLHKYGSDIAIPIKRLAEYWVAYYWPFVLDNPIYQGPRAMRGGILRNDMAFREDLTSFRESWEEVIGTKSRASDGFYIITEFRSPRRRSQYPQELWEQYRSLLKKLNYTIANQPIRYAGPSEEQWSVFEPPKSFKDINDRVIDVPGTNSKDKCLIINHDLWLQFLRQSLWIEALCIHEWSLFTERQQQDWDIDRGEVYTLLTEQPEERRPLVEERNWINQLISKGSNFFCPWTGKLITTPNTYQLDHILPIAVYPINELWNLVPANPRANLLKRDRVPARSRLEKASTTLAQTYRNYASSKILRNALQQDTSLRFRSIDLEHSSAAGITHLVIDFVDQVASFRNLARY